MHMALSEEQKKKIREYARKRVKAGNLRKFALPKKPKEPAPETTPPAKPKS